MTKETKKERIIQAMNETERMLETAEKRYADSIEALKMDVAKNGNDKKANKDWVDYCNKDKERVKAQKMHMEKLEKMLLELETA